VQVILRELNSSLGESILWGLGLGSSSWDNPVCVGLVKLHKLGKIKLRLLKDLDFLDEDVLKWEDLGALLCDSLTNLVSDELLEELSEC